MKSPRMHRQRDGDADHERGPEGRAAGPLGALPGEQKGGERDAHQIVDGPADRPLAGNGWRPGDGLMHEAPARHPRDPSADQAVVGRRCCEQGPAAGGHGVHEGGGADADHGGACHEACCCHRLLLVLVGGVVVVVIGVGELGVVDPPAAEL